MPEVYAHDREGSQCAYEICGGTRYDPCSYTQDELDEIRLKQIEPHEFEAFEGATGNTCTKMVLIDDFGEDCGLSPSHEKHNV